MKDYFEALYYGVCTLTTVGGITPETAEGRIVVIVSILAGIAIIPFQLSKVGEAYFQRDQELLEAQECILPDGAEGAEGAEGVVGADAWAPQPALDAFLEGAEWDEGGKGGGEGGEGGEGELAARARRGLQGEQSAGLDATGPFGDAFGGREAFSSVSSVMQDQEAELTAAACGACGATGHRRDAVFCYRCSSRIIPVQGGGGGGG